MRRKRAKYPELVASPDAALLVVAIELGGRWSSEAASFVSDLAWVRARTVPTLLQTAAANAWRARWTAMMAVAAQAAFAATLRGYEPGTAAGRDGEAPGLSALFAEALPEPPAFSRLPLR